MTIGSQASSPVGLGFPREAVKRLWQLRAKIFASNALCRAYAAGRQRGEGRGEYTQLKATRPRPGAANAIRPRHDELIRLIKRKEPQSMKTRKAQGSRRQINGKMRVTYVDARTLKPSDENSMLYRDQHPNRVQGTAK